MVAGGVVLLPVPAVGAHVLDAIFGHPAQLPLGLGGVGVALGDVAGAAGLGGPEPAMLLDELRRAGFDLPLDALSVEECAQTLRDFLTKA